MATLEDIFLAIKSSSNCVKVSGDFIPAPPKSENAGKSFLYLNCYLKDGESFSHEGYRELLGQTALMVQQAKFSEAYVSLVFTVYCLSPEKPLRLYRAVVKRGHLKEVANITDPEGCIEREDFLHP